MGTWCPAGGREPSAEQSPAAKVPWSQFLGSPLVAPPCAPVPPPRDKTLEVAVAFPAAVRAAAAVRAIGFRLR